jgi:hypothetical protein
MLRSLLNPSVCLSSLLIKKRNCRFVIVRRVISGDTSEGAPIPVPGDALRHFSGVQRQGVEAGFGGGGGGDGGGRGGVEMGVGGAVRRGLKLESWSRGISKALCWSQKMLPHLRQWWRRVK